MIKKSVIAFLFLFLSSNFQLAFGEGPNNMIDLDTITLQEAIDIALRRSPAVRQAEVAQSRDETRLGQETWWFWLKPNLSFRVGYDDEDGRPFFSSSGNVDFRDFLYEGKRRIDIINLDLDESKERVFNIKNIIIARVTNAYNDYRLAKEKIMLYEEWVKQSKELQERLQKLSDKGSLDPMFLFILRYLVNQDNVNLIAARQDLLRTETNFREALGVAAKIGSIKEAKEVIR